MKAIVNIVNTGTGYYADIEIEHDFVGRFLLSSKTIKSKGETKRKAIQFCDALNLQYEFVGYL